MIPTMLIGWFWVVPLTIKKLNLSLKNYLGYHVQGTLPALVVFGLILAGLTAWMPATATSGFFALGWRAALCMAPLFWLGRHVILSMSRIGDEAE
jgi:hypothetical protein